MHAIFCWGIWWLVACKTVWLAYRRRYRWTFRFQVQTLKFCFFLWRQACVAWPRAPFTLTESPPTSSTRSLLLRSKFFSVEKAKKKQKQKQKMSKTRRKVDISGSLPQSSGKQVWAGSRSLHRLGWICAVYPGRTRLRSVSARRLQHQVSGCMGSASFQICRSERRRVIQRPFKLIVQFENIAAKNFPGLLSNVGSC